MIDKIRLLTVDDEVSFTRMLKLNLERTDRYEVCVVNDPMRAIHAAREFRPDVILLDVVMPTLDGGDVMSALSNDYLLKDIPVILVTALFTAGEVSRGAVGQSGNNTVLSKPLNVETLDTAINQTLEGILV